jgi:hypothetical protein
MVSYPVLGVQFVGRSLAATMAALREERLAREAETNT